MLIATLAVCTPGASAQEPEGQVRAEQASSSVSRAPIEVFFRNNKGWFKPITLIYYEPGDARGKVESRLLLPWQRFSMELPPNTRVYIVTSEQVERYRAGASLRHLPPAMTIRPSDEGELYNLFR